MHDLYFYFDCCFEKLAFLFSCVQDVTCVAVQSRASLVNTVDSRLHAAGSLNSLTAFDGRDWRNCWQGLWSTPERLMSRDERHGDVVGGLL